MKYNFAYYFRECPTCKNHKRHLVREAALVAGVKVDERWIEAMPDLWGKECDKIAEATGQQEPLIYNLVDGTALSITEDTGKSSIVEFLSPSPSEML